MLILPKLSSPDARVCTFAHPRTSRPSRYYFDPEQGVYEFTRVAAPKSAYRSWLIGAQPRVSSTYHKGSDDKDEILTFKKPEVGRGSYRPISNGCVVKNAELLIATPIDCLFLLLSAFCDQSLGKSPSSKGLFLSADDHIESLFGGSKHLSHLAAHGPTRQTMEARMEVVCDTVDAGEEKMYRLNEVKLLNELVLKAERMVYIGLPASMEESFIRRTLETPVMAIKHEESSLSDRIDSQTDTSISTPISIDRVDSQTSTATADSVITSISAGTDITVPEILPLFTDGINLHHLLRLRTALTYMISSYVPLPLARTLDKLMATNESPIDFEPLDERLAQLAKLRAEALAARSFGDFSRKRNMHEDDDAAESKAEKKRRKDEEEKKKKLGESRGLRDLKKVDTKGMKKMSDFFGKGAVAKKK